jgi:hypothetical protein
LKINHAGRILFRILNKKDLSGHNKQENKIGDAIALNPGTEIIPKYMVESYI